MGGATMTPDDASILGWAGVTIFALVATACMVKAIFNFSRNPNSVSSEDFNKCNAIRNNYKQSLSAQITAEELWPLAEKRAQERQPLSSEPSKSLRPRVEMLSLAHRLAGQQEELARQLDTT